MDQAIKNTWLASRSSVGSCMLNSLNRIHLDQFYPDGERKTLSFLSLSKAVTTVSQCWGLPVCCHVDEALLRLLLLNSIASLSLSHTISKISLRSSLHLHIVIVLTRGQLNINA